MATTCGDRTALRCSQREAASAEQVLPGVTAPARAYSPLKTRMTSPAGKPDRRAYG